MKRSYVTVTDQFCGAGGSSTGAVAAGAEVVMALNHWKLAIETHNTNHPQTRHDCTDISACDPRRYPATDILITSPECFPAGTLILTARGLTPIEEVVVGDEVLTHRSRWQRVTEVMSTVRDTVIVRGQGHRALEVSGAHPFYVRQQYQVWNQVKRDYDRRQLSEPQWIEARSLTTSTFRWGSPAAVPALEVPPVRGENARGMEFSPAFWWMVGRWLGDGSVRLRDDASSEITICCGKHEVAELEALHFAPRSGPHASGNELHWRKREIRTSYLFEAVHDSLARWLVEHFGKGAHGKTIPAWAFGMPVDWREALVAGYVSADGCRSNRIGLASSVSKALALGVRLLLTGLGFHPSFGKYHHKAGYIEGRPFDAYDLWTVRWELNKSQRSGINDGACSWTLVKNVQPGRENVVVYNLSVEEDESYVADGIVVHNCTNHSLAKGAKRTAAQRSLFDGKAPDPAAERSRATMFDVCRFAEYHRYNLIIVENVPDARHWVMWDAWIHAMHLLGYEHKVVYFNSMFAHPTPQSRDRMYVVFWRKGNKAPDLDFHPLAWCQPCGRDVSSVQSWKNPAKPWGKYKQQYLYRCPSCAGVVEPYYYAAYNAIDWSLSAPRIGDRERPLKEKTLNRIKVGLEKFGRQPMPAFLTSLAYGHGHDRRSSSVLAPMRTQTANADLGVAVPPMTVQTSQYQEASATRSVTQPLPTQTTRQDMALLVPPAWIVGNFTPGWCRPVSEPMGTCTTVDHHAVVTAPIITSYYGTSEGQPVTAPLGTVTTVDRHGVVVPPFVLSYYTRLSGDQAAVQMLNEALPTVPGRAVHYLAQPGETPAVEDCGFRMVQPHEIQAAMAFPSDYVVLGNQREKVRQLGNAVTPPVMQMLVERCVATLGGA